MRNELCIAFSYLYMHIYEGIGDLISFLQLNFPSPTPEKKPLSFEGLEIVEVKQKLKLKIFSFIIFLPKNNFRVLVICISMILKLLMKKLKKNTLPI